MRRRLSRLLPALLVPVLLLGARSAAGQVKKITSVEGITEYRLDNGLKVLLFPDASKPTVTVNLTVFVGSRQEGYGEAGMAHLLEHMLFKGTPTHQKIPKELQDRGASFNGSTWLDRTNYFETLPAEGDNLPFALGLEADRLVNSSIKGEDLKSEMTVVRSEFERGENSPRYVLDQRMMSAAYEWHNYGKATIGNRADIERVPVERLRVFYRKYYQPDNAMLIVAGKFDPKETLKRIVKDFGKIPRPKRKLDNTYTEEPAQDGERTVVLRRVGDVAVVGALYHICSGPHPDYPPLDVLESILTAPPSGRLYKALVETKRAANVNGSAYALHDPGVLQFMATVNKGNDPHLVLQAMLETIDHVAEDGVKQQEVDRARRRLLKQWDLATANSRRLAVQLSEWAAQGDWRLYFLYRDRVAKVTKADVDRVAKKYLKRNNRTVGLFIPTKEPERAAIPETPNIARMLRNYKGKKEIVAGEAFDVSPANIEARTKRVTLSGGAKAALLPKKTRGETVRLELELCYGNAENLKNRATAARFLPSLMTRGTKRHNRQELQDALDRAKARLSASGSAGTATFRLETKREQLASALKLLREVLREPTLPDSELEILKRSRVASLQQALTSPQMLASNAVQRKISPYPKGDPRYVATVPESIDLTRSVSDDDVKKLYGEYLGGGHAVVSVVGDFDEKQVLAALEETLADWKAKQPYERLKQTAGSGKRGSSREILTPGKANAVYFAAETFPLRDDDPDFAPLELGNFILGGGSLASRLGTRIRQKEGLSYAVGSGFHASALDKRAVVYLYAICNPKNMSKVKAAMREEVKKLLKSGVTRDELNAAQSGYLQKLRLQFSRDSTLASVLSETITARRTMKYYVDLERRIKSATPEEVLRAVQRRVKFDRFHIATAGDFAKAGKAKAAANAKKK